MEVYGGAKCFAAAVRWSATWQRQHSGATSLLRSVVGTHTAAQRRFSSLSALRRATADALSQQSPSLLGSLLRLELPQGFGSEKGSDGSSSSSSTSSSAKPTPSSGSGGDGGDGGDGDDEGKPTNKKKDKDGAGDDESTEDDKDKDKDKSGKKRAKSQEEQFAENLQSMFGEHGQWIGILAIASLMWAMSTATSKDGGPSSEVTWQTVRNEYLANGWVERLEVVNKEKVVVHLRNTPLHPTTTDPAGSFESPPPASTTSSSSSSSTSPALATRGANKLFFKIGSIESFERQLEDAQLDLGIHPRDFVSVKYIENTNWSESFLKILPTVAIIGFWYFILTRGMGGGGPGGGGPGGMNRIFSIGKANAATAKDSKVKVRFDDVAGCDEAKREIVEFVDFLKDPTKFSRLGAKIPKGALLVGPPGTGKTLLAKATAGEADVPFFSMSGSDFIEMFVGVGPSRVRDLFKQAREEAPCIVFIDEIDAVARARSKGGFSGGNDERENTLNQLLVEMDGFSSAEGVVVLGGTNRVDILDKAILRPGRFDRQVSVDLPDIEGRQKIFEVHMKPLTVKDAAADGAEIAKRLASLTPGFSGADISNVCNEAAIVAARRDKQAIDMTDFEAAIDRVVGGLEKNRSLMTKDERRTVAYHEAGHAVAGWFLEHADPLLKVTIVPRTSGALGFAQYLPKELALFTKEALLDKICMALGGRVAEELNFGRITTGAADDLDKVTQMAYSMTSIYGMNSKVGYLSFPPKDETQFNKPYSDSTAKLIDEEVRALVADAHARTTALLKKHEKGLAELAELLLERETINQHDVIKILGARPFESDHAMQAFVDAGGFSTEDAAVEPDVIEDGAGASTDGDDDKAAETSSSGDKP